MTFGLKTAKFVFLHFDFGEVECSLSLFYDVTHAPFFILISFMLIAHAVLEHPACPINNLLKY